MLETEIIGNINVNIFNYLVFCFKIKELFDCINYETEFLYEAS